MIQAVFPPPERFVTLRTGKNGCRVKKLRVVTQFVEQDFDNTPGVLLAEHRMIGQAQLRGLKKRKDTINPVLYHILEERFAKMADAQTFPLAGSATEGASSHGF